jgi:hypothetical protein
MIRRPTLQTHRMPVRPSNMAPPTAAEMTDSKGRNDSGET